MTSPHTHRGRVYRRCACRHAGKQLGAHCPELTSNARHGTWTFAVDMPSLTGKRTTMRRGGFPTRKGCDRRTDPCPRVRALRDLARRPADRRRVPHHLVGREVPNA